MYVVFELYVITRAFSSAGEIFIIAPGHIYWSTLCFCRGLRESIPSSSIHCCGRERESSGLRSTKSEEVVPKKTSLGKSIAEA